LFHDSSNYPIFYKESQGKSISLCNDIVIEKFN
jgi:hypothetical protein